jgi:hypothetical protein
MLDFKGLIKHNDNFYETRYKSYTFFWTVRRLSRKKMQYSYGLDFAVKWSALVSHSEGPDFNCRTQDRLRWQFCHDFSQSLHANMGLSHSGHDRFLCIISDSSLLSFRIWCRSVWYIISSGEGIVPSSGQKVPTKYLLGITYQNTAIFTYTRSVSKM